MHTQPRKHMLHHADCALSAKQCELNHTDQESICPEVLRLFYVEIGGLPPQCVERLDRRTGPWPIAGASTMFKLLFHPAAIAAGYLACLHACDEARKKHFVFPIFLGRERLPARPIVERTPANIAKPFSYSLERVPPLSRRRSRDWYC